MSIPIIFVGCGNFSIQRLQVIIDGNLFTPVACVDIDIEKARSNLEYLQGNVPEGLTDRVYTTITEAKEKHDAEVCFIFAVAKAHSRMHFLAYKSQWLGTERHMCRGRKNPATKPAGPSFRERISGRGIKIS